MEPRDEVKAAVGSISAVIDAFLHRFRPYLPILYAMEHRGYFIRVYNRPGTGERVCWLTQIPNTAHELYAEQLRQRTTRWYTYASNVDILLTNGLIEVARQESNAESYEDAARLNLPISGLNYDHETRTTFYRLTAEATELIKGSNPARGTR